MKKFLFLFLFLIIKLNAQTFSVSGKVTDSKGNAVENATVTVLKQKDSTVVGFMGTSKSGNFSLKIPAQAQPSVLQISADNFRIFTRRLENFDRNLQLGNIKLETESVTDIEGVTIVASPIKIKKDTVEYNASYIKVKPDDKIDELLKQIPGVETDEDGKITVNGQPINKILINGKPFFNKDGKIALETFNADIIKKIQITTSKTKEEALTGRTPVSDSLTVNFNIDERNNKGNILNANLGYGTDNRYDLKLLLARFKQNTNYALIAGSNNINVSDFSVDGFFEKNNRNNAARGKTMNAGILRTSMVGVNFADKIGDNFDLEKFSLEYKDTSFETYSKTLRTVFLPNYTLDNSAERGGNTDRSIFNFNTDGSLKLNPLTTIIFSADFSNNTTDSDQYNNTSTVRDGLLLNTGNSTSRGSTATNSFIPRLSVVKNFSKKRRSLTASVENTFYDNSSKTFNILETVFIQNPTESSYRNQLFKNRNTRNLFGANFKYFEPVSDSATVSLEMNYDFNQISDDRSVNNFSAETGGYTSFSPLFSNKLDQDNNLLNVGVAYNLNKNRYNFRLGTNLNMTRLNLDSYYNYEEFNVKKNYSLPEYNLLLNYKFNKSTNLRFSNNATFTVPQSAFLNPYVDISNPLITIQGNPNLKSTWQNNTVLNFTTFNTAKGLNFNARANFNYTDNDIVNYSYYDNSGRQFSTYENISGNKRLNMGANLTKTHKWKGNKLDIGPSFTANYSFRRGFINASEYTNNIWTYAPRLNINIDLKDRMNLRTSYSVNFSTSHYTNYRVDETKNSRQVLSVKLTNYFLAKDLFFSNDFTFTRNSNVSSAFSRDSYFWNSAVNYQFFKKQMMLKLSVYDLLNQRQNSVRTIGDNYVEDKEELVLRRYFMLSWIVNLRKAG